ncbi:hypothetical protein DFS33DRAFT_373816 [Desarmillaria ectypa]|nr:hypothetical protein DFS33DRAFT_373816 [Desarmillaria ectypa]
MSLPLPVASGSRKSRASKRFPTGEEEKPLASSSKVKAPAMVTVKNKQYLALSTHKYGRAAPIPVKDAEVDAITQASTVPQYGCAQCSSSVQNQSCIFLGWGNRCNNCEAATKSLCSFRAEPLQRYFARRELAKFVEATPDNVRTSIGRAAIALQVFETCANAAALAAQQYRTSLEEALRICQDAATSEGRDALQGIVFESVDFEEQLRAALLKMDMSSPALLTTSETDSLPSTVAPTVSRTLLESESPSRPLIGSSGVPTIPVRSREGGMAPKVDSSDQVGALVDQLASSPVHHLSPESPEAA